MVTIKERLDTVNSLLQAGEPHNVSVDTYGGYIGYKPQSIIDAMNDAFDIGTWGFEEISNGIEPGDKGGLAVAQVKVWIKDVDFHPMAYGQSRVTKGDIGDAKKGAQTDAIKKALSYFSVGNRAYLGLLIDPDETKKPQQHRGNPQQQTHSEPQQTVKSLQSNKGTPLPQRTPSASSPTPQDALKTRLDTVYNRLLANGTINRELGKEAKMVRFFEWCSTVLNANIAATGHITASRMDILEKALQEMAQPVGM